MAASGHRGICTYQVKWEQNPKYKDWIKAFKGDKRKALCTACDRIIDLSTMGESALRSHMNGDKHQHNVGRTVKPTVTLKSFFNSVSVDDLRVPPPPVSAPVNTPTVAPLVTPRAPLASMVINDDSVLKAEALWTLKLVTNHHSYRSSADTTDLFKEMFPDSSIAKAFKCGERKAAYNTVYGLAEHFRKILKNDIKGPFVILFDESLNRKLQQKQLDVLVRFWNHNHVRTRYLTSEFLGK